MTRSRKFISANDLVKLRTYLSNIENHILHKFIIDLLSKEPTAIVDIVAVYINKAVDSINKATENEEEKISIRIKSIEGDVNLAPGIQYFYDVVKNRLRELEAGGFVKPLVRGSRKGKKYKITEVEKAREWLEQNKQSVSEKLSLIATFDVENRDELKEAILAVVQNNPGIHVEQITANINTHYSNVTIRRDIQTLAEIGSLSMRFKEEKHKTGCYLTHGYIISAHKHHLITDEKRDELIGSHISSNDNQENISNQSVTSTRNAKRKMEEENTSEKKRHNGQEVYEGLRRFHLHAKATMSVIEISSSDADAESEFSPSSSDSYESSGPDL